MSELEVAGLEVAPSGFEELARGALLDATDARSVGPLVSEVDEGDGVVTLRFESNLPGYLGWKWAVSVARIGEAQPTVLESELVPGDGALLAPEWVPWSDRMDELNASRAAAEAEGESDEDSADEDELDDDDLADDDDLVDEEDLVDEQDLGDDVYDGVDLEAVLGDSEDDDEESDDYDDLGESDVEDDPEDRDSDAAAVGVDEAEEAESDSGDAGPDEAGAVDPDDAAKTEQQPDQGE
jgi:hypothetical protein